MALFNKKKQASVAFQDDYFLKIESLSSNHPFILAVKEQEGVELPYLTFAAFEVRANHWLDQRQTIEESLDLGRVEVTYQNEGQLSQEEEGFIEQLVIKEGYATVLQVISETVFNHNAFDPFTFDQKKSYLLDLFEAWGKSLSCKGDVVFLPEFPKQEAEGLEYITIEMAEDFPYHRFKAVPEEHSESEGAEAVVSSNHKEEINASDFPDKNAENNELVFGTSNNNEVPVTPSQNQSSSNIGETKKPVPAISLKSLDKFEIVQDPQGVEKDLNAYRQRYNREIEAIDEKIQPLQKAVINRRLSILEVSEKQQIALQLQKQDNRAQIKSKILNSERQTFSKAEQKLKLSLNEEKQLLLDEAKRTYEAQIQKINVESNQRWNQELEKLQKSHLSLTQEKLKNQLVEVEQKLERFVSGELSLLQEKLRKKQLLLEKEATEALHIQNQAVNSYYSQLLDQRRVELLEQSHAIPSKLSEFDNEATAPVEEKHVSVVDSTQQQKPHSLKYKVRSKATPVNENTDKDTWVDKYKDKERNPDLISLEGNKIENQKHGRAFGKNSLSKLKHYALVALILLGIGGAGYITGYSALQSIQGNQPPQTHQTK
ncbi:hypothetical protein QUD55_02680 [Lactococcus lactis]|uniref:hypothetical protein n=1 Tax=Lactococcus lactis TaxID=1358 RepID=UPI0025A11C9C|nr:hypothetical protein [Lactococcus lactis]MDM7536380.1 hypothetical protein [Lactococcus lactis]